MASEVIEPTTFKSEIESAVEQSVIRKVTRLSFMLLLIYFFSSLDRSNIGFLAVQMTKDLGFDARMFGLGVSVFFAAYMIFQFPVMSFASRFGAAKPLAVVIAIWGLATTCMAFVHDLHSFLTLRALVGAAEAGATPLTWLYISRWVPRQMLGRFLLRQTLSMPASFLLGAPLSAWINATFSGVLGLHGWVWMFIIEGGLTLVVAALAWTLLPERPKDARWLNGAEQSWLERELRPSEGGGIGFRELRAVSLDPVIWILMFAWLSVSMGLNGYLFWLPQVLAAAEHGANSAQLGLLLSTIPWVGVTLGIVLTGYLSDRAGERYWHCIAPTAAAGFGMALAALSSGPVMQVLGLTIGGVGLGGADVIVFSLPILHLKDPKKAAAGLTFITWLAQFAGVGGGYVIGVLRKQSGGFQSGLLLLASLLGVGALLIIGLWRHKRAVAARIDVSSALTG